jgi:hypothetical protein
VVGVLGEAGDAFALASAACRLRLARENGSWGYLRFVGELPKLGIDISATLVRNLLRAAGVPPAPQRGQVNWRSFLRQHGETILACDFLTVDTVLLRRLYVLVFICIGSRRIEYVACTSNPDGAWMLNQASGDRRAGRTAADGYRSYRGHHTAWISPGALQHRDLRTRGRSLAARSPERQMGATCVPRSDSTATSGSAVMNTRRL